MAVNGGAASPDSDAERAAIHVRCRTPPCFQHLLTAQHDVRPRRLRQGKTHEGLHALLWPISRLLVRYVEAHLPQFQGARVLELGAGVGLSGIGAAAYGSHVVLTDKVRSGGSASNDTCPRAERAPAVQDTRLTAVNVEAAQAVGVSGSVKAASCDWESPQAFLASSESALGWDWILGSDIVYHQQFDYTHIQALAKLLATLLDAAQQQGQKQPTILFGYQERDSAARLAFWEALASHGLGVTIHTLVRGNARCGGW